ncbi:MAG TPA: hypothetical protein VME66_05775, partial [Candidatus Acidoferrales bacterium]|nr:hypothetical protein [Candidatus Acidoferrales bacterium]
SVEDDDAPVPLEYAADPGYWIIPKYGSKHEFGVQPIRRLLRHLSPRLIGAIGRDEFDGLGVSAWAYAGVDRDCGERLALALELCLHLRLRLSKTQVEAFMGAAQRQLDGRTPLDILIHESPKRARTLLSPFLDKSFIVSALLGARRS